MAELAPPQVDPVTAQDTARSILSGRKYLEAARPPSLRDRAIDWITERIGDLLNALSSGGGRGVIAWLIVGVFVAIIVFLLVRLLREAEPVRRVAPVEGPDISLFTERTADEWLAAAHEAEAESDWREGIRCRHRALTVELYDRGLVEARPGQTASDIDRQASQAQPRLDEPLTAATRLFEDVWYGWRVADVSARDTFVAHVDSVRSMVSVEPATTGAGAS